MKIAIYLDAVSQDIDNATQWHIMGHVGHALQSIHDVCYIDPRIIGMDDAKRQLLEQDYDVLLTYNKTGTNLRCISEQMLLKQINVPQVAWLTEHPVTFFNQYYETDSRKRHYIFTTPQHRFFARKMGLVGSISALQFGSHRQEKTDSYNKRLFDICIAVQWRGTPEVNNFWSQLPAKQRQFFEDVNTLQQLDEHGDVFTAFYAAAEHYQLPLEHIRGYAAHMKALYWHARKIERIKLVNDLVSSGLKILLIGGTEWKKVLPQYKNVTFVPPCSPNELINYYKQSRAVASTNCYNGANERTYDAMSSGAISIAEDSPTLKQFFTDEKHLIMYPRLRANLKVPLIVELLRDTSKGESLAAQGNAEFHTAHTWDHRAIALDQVIRSLINVEVN